MHFIIKSSTPSVLKAVQSEIRTLDHNLAFADAVPLERFVGNSILSERVATCIFGLFSILALVLAALGIYGVMATAVSQRTREIGIRIALGAKTSDIQRLVTSKGLVLISLGTGLGLLSSLSASGLLASFLYGVSPIDAWTFGAVTLFLALVALLACWLPAYRATKVDPMTALRCE